MKAVNIKWDINYDETASLPTEVAIPENLTDPGAICEWLTEKYGYCHDGFKIEMTEEGHIYADDLICDILTTLGLSDVVAEFSKLDKWYS